MASISRIAQDYPELSGIGVYLQFISDCWDIRLPRETRELLVRHQDKVFDVAYKDSVPVGDADLDILF